MEPSQSSILAWALAHVSPDSSLESNYFQSFSTPNSTSPSSIHPESARSWFLSLSPLDVCVWSDKSVPSPSDRMVCECTHYATCCECFNSDLFSFSSGTIVFSFTKDPIPLSKELFGVTNMWRSSISSKSSLSWTANLARSFLSSVTSHLLSESV